MNITIIEKEGYEADDVLGTLAKRGEKEGLEVTVVSGDRDTFQLASEKIKIRIRFLRVSERIFIFQTKKFPMLQNPTAFLSGFHV